MLYLICTTITSVDLAHYGVSCAKDWVSVDCGTSHFHYYFRFIVNFETENHLALSPCSVQY